MNTIHEAFHIIKQKSFFETYTTINPAGGIQHRLAGIGTHKTHQKKELRPDDITAINAGFIKLAEDLVKLADPAAGEVNSTLIDHPGVLLETIIMDSGYDYLHLARAINSTTEHIGKVIDGKRDISPEFAVKLETVLPVTAEEWLSIQTKFNLKKVRKEAGHDS